VVRIRRCASCVSVAHALQDLRELVALGGPAATRWRAVLTEAERHQRNAVWAADLCAACGAERLAFHPNRPCPVCDGWTRPEHVRGVALRHLREDVALSGPQRLTDAGSECAVSA
jgi:hypothetical protein